MDPSACEATYSRLVDDAQCGGAVRRGALRGGPTRFSPPPGSYRLATVFLTVLCLVLLVCLIAVTSHHHGVSMSEGETGEAKTGRQEQEMNLTALTADLRRLQQENTELRAKLAIKAKTEATKVPQTRLTSAAAPPAVSSTAAAPVVRTAVPPVVRTAVPPVVRTAVPPVVRTAVPPVVRTTVPPVGCPEGWLPFQGRCYLVSERTADWYASQQYCQRKGGHLAIILTPEEQGFLWGLLPRGHWRAYWIGLTDAHTEDNWKWVDGTPLIGGFWEEGEPNNHIDEDCGYMVKTQKLERVAERSWYDAPCSMSWPFLCQKAQGSG